MAIKGNVTKIKLPNGDDYNIKDTVSGYLVSNNIIAGDNVTVNESSEGVIISSVSGGGASASVTNHVLFIATSIENGDNTGY